MENLQQLSDRLDAIERGGRIESTYLWDAIQEIRRAVSRLEDHGNVIPRSQWLMGAGTRHSDAGPDAGA